MIDLKDQYLQFGHLMDLINIKFLWLGLSRGVYIN